MTTLTYFIPLFFKFSCRNNYTDRIIFLKHTTCYKVRGPWCKLIQSCYHIPFIHLSRSRSRQREREIYQMWLTFQVVHIHNYKDVKFVFFVWFNRFLTPMSTLYKSYRYRLYLTYGSHTWFGMYNINPL